jgi:pimeloyl-ACP methyl ester carboxylesterase
VPCLPYQPGHPGTSRFLTLRGLRHHLHEWGDAGVATPERPTLVMAHGWMDVGASFQFVVDALREVGDGPRHIVAPDWRGFGLTDASGSDSYWFPDYLGDLDALLSAISPDRPVDLLGHSMGGNVVMSYAGVRPLRVRRLVNLEGFGLPATTPQEAPARLAAWLDELVRPVALKDYGAIDEVAARLIANNPRLRPDRAAWLALHWARPDAAGRWQILGDPAHKRTNPVLYRVEEILATWAAIAAPLLWVEGAQTEAERWWRGRYTRQEFDQRLTRVGSPVRRVTLADAAHMLHHDQPEALAQELKVFLDNAPPWNCPP